MPVNDIKRFSATLLKRNNYIVPKVIHSSLCYWVAFYGKQTVSENKMKDMAG